MASAEKCPICDGSGQYRPPSRHNTIMFPLPRPCRACQGYGWLGAWHPGQPTSEDGIMRAARIEEGARALQGQPSLLKAMQEGLEALKEGKPLVTREVEE